MDEFERADSDDHELDRADEHELERLDWLELHGLHLEHPTFDEAVRQAGHDKRRVALGSELLFEDEFDDG